MKFLKGEMWIKCEKLLNYIEKEFPTTFIKKYKSGIFIMIAQFERLHNRLPTINEILSEIKEFRKNIGE